MVIQYLTSYYYPCLSSRMLFMYFIVQNFNFLIIFYLNDTDLFQIFVEYLNRFNYLCYIPSIFYFRTYFINLVFNLKFKYEFHHILYFGGQNPKISLVAFSTGMSLNKFRFVSFCYALYFARFCVIHRVTHIEIRGFCFRNRSST